jgi:hypothetical protein
MNDPRQLITEEVANPRANGIKRPVLLECSPQSTQAQAIHRAITGKTLEPPEEADPNPEWGPTLAVKLSEACRLLREHGGAGGAWVADHLADAIVQADGFVVLLRADGLRYGTFDGNRFLTSGEIGWDGVPWDERQILQLLRDDGPTPTAVGRGRSRRPSRR